MSGKNQLVGAAGEHFVMGELLARGWIAALAPQGVANMDVLLSDVTGNTLCAIQVKTRSAMGGDSGWYMGKKHEEEFATAGGFKLFFCFVNLAVQQALRPEYFIIPGGVVASVVRDSHAAWLRNTKKNGEQRKNSDIRRIRPDYSSAYAPEPCPYSVDWMEQYRNAWESLLGKP
jgi:hypothetical protein